MGVSKKTLLPQPLGQFVKAKGVKCILRGSTHHFVELSEAHNLRCGFYINVTGLKSKF